MGLLWCSQAARLLPLSFGPSTSGDTTDTKTRPTHGRRAHLWCYGACGQADPAGVKPASSIHCVTPSASSDCKDFQPTSRCRCRHMPLMQQPSIPAAHIPLRPRSTQRSDAEHVEVRACARLPASMESRTRRSDASCRCQRRLRRAPAALAHRMLRGHHEEQPRNWYSYQGMLSDASCLLAHCHPGVPAVQKSAI
jgi:hypothetical protein